jgi:2-oxoglutarate dehydrogenase E2 component (dihydrolipoamide succinyltransferase)
MKIEVRVPQLPESLADALLVSWHKVAGDGVARDENLADLETDKVVLEILAPQAGVLCDLTVAAGTTVTSGMLLAAIDTGQTAHAAPVTRATPIASPMAPAAKKAATAAMVATAGPSPTGVQIELPQTEGSLALPRPPPVAWVPSGPPPPDAERALPSAPRTGQQRVPMSRLRARIARRLVETQNSQALLSTFNEVDMSAVKALRTRYKEKFEKQHGVRLGLMPFFVKAAVNALKQFPVINASLDGDDIVYQQSYDIGVAVATERGLIVPVLRGADAMRFADIERAVASCADRARLGTITLEELTGGTFTITNGGVFGSLNSTPIVNAPQSGILGLHCVQDRPVGVNGEIVLRPMMNLALTYDHRLIDGREAVGFLVAIKALIEDPARLLLEI